MRENTRDKKAKLTMLAAAAGQCGLRDGGEEGRGGRGGGRRAGAAPSTTTNACMGLVSWVN